MYFGVKAYANHGPGLLNDREPRPVAVLDVLAEGALDDDDVLPEMFKIMI